MSTTPPSEPKRESLAISAALILSLVGLTLLLVIAILIKREIRRGNVKSKRDGHFWSCKFFRKCAQAKVPKDGKIPEKVRPQWLLAAYHELPEHYYVKNECPQYIARMFLIDLYNVFHYTCRETFPDIDTHSKWEIYLIRRYSGLNETIQSFERLKVRAEIDLVPFTLEETKHGIEMFNQLLQKLSTYVNNPYLTQRQIDLTYFNQNQEQEEQSIKMSSRYIPLLPKDLCHIPLRPIDDDSLNNLNKRSRAKGRFPFHLPSFLNKRRLFSTKLSSASKLRTDSSANNSEYLVEDPEINQPLNNNASNRQQIRQRVKRETAIDAVPLVEFHDTLSQSVLSNTDNDTDT